MKAEILKIAGVKSEKEFYKKYPTEEAFMKAHKKEFKKAAMGAKMVKTQLEQLTDFGNPPQAQVGTYVPGQGVPQTQMYSPSNTGIPSNILSMGYGSTPATVGGVQVFPQQPSTFNLGSSGNVQLPSNFLSQGYSGIGSGKVPGTDWVGKLGGPAGIGNIAGQIYGGIQAEKSWKEQKKKSKATRDISALTLRAAQSRPKDQIRNQYLRPEDQLTNPNELFPTYGVGTNYLAKDGTTVMQVGGNLGEIQNTYAPNTLYDNLGYEPLDESNIVKQYVYGGVAKAQDGTNSLGSFLSTFGGGNASGASGGDEQVGGLGNLIGTGGDIVGKLAPAGSAVAGIAGPLAGFAKFAINDQRKRTLANNAAATKKNLEKAAFTSGMQAIQGQYGGFMEDGGWVSHDWQPQVITQFGEHSMQDLLRRDPQMDTLRTGGHITQNNMFPTDQYALGGELRTTWGGYAEPISYNPHMPGSGETVMFKGIKKKTSDGKTKTIGAHSQSDGKGHTGIGVKYGSGSDDSYTDYAEYGSRDADADVEVEKGEPATEMIDGQTGEKNMVVFGNLKIPNMFLDQIGDPKAKGKKFKNYVADLGKKEAKQNKIIDKASREIDELDVLTPFDKLKLDGLTAMITGANLKLKDAALRKANAAAVQSAINDTASEHGVDADSLAKGKYKMDPKAMGEQARFGKDVPKAQKGKKNFQNEKEISDYYRSMGYTGPSDIDLLQKWIIEKAKTDPEVDKELTGYLQSVPTTNKGKNLYGKNKKASDLTKEELYNQFNDELWGYRFPKLQSLAKKPTTSTYTTIPPLIKKEKQDQDMSTITLQKPPAKQKYDWMDLISSALPYFRPSDQEPFDYSQTYPEMMALSMNQLEPVKAQLYNPLLEQPYDISLQDQLNANQADFNALQRQSGYNPEALATLAAQKYAANSSVLGEQFRLNQAEKAGVYGRNRATLNDAQLKNLGILDQQFVRQETAKSRTKEQALEAMKSIADKVAKNKLENRTLGIYENLYNYRYDKNGRAINMNAPVKFEGQVPGATGGPIKIPSTATNPIVSGARTAAVYQNPSALADPANLPYFLDPNAEPYGQLPTLEELYPEETVYPTEQKYGGKTKKKKTNGSIVKAIKNL